MSSGQYESNSIDDEAAVNGPGLSSTADEQLDLIHRIASLERENKRLKATQLVCTRHQVLYFLPEATAVRPPGTINMHPPVRMAYLDEPTWSIGPTGEIMLRAHSPITDVNGYLRQRPEIQDTEVRSAARSKQVLPRPKPTSELLTLHSPEMIDAVESFFAQQPRFSEEFPYLNIRDSIPSPYLFWYHYRSPTALDVLDPSRQNVMRLLTSWIEKHYAEKFDLVNDQLERGVISQETMPFLVKPGDVLVWKDGEEINAVVSKSWPYQISPTLVIPERKEKERDWAQDKSQSDKCTTKWTVKSWKFKFDGGFYRKELPITINFSCDKFDDEVRIDGLNIIPLNYAPHQYKATLENRGRSFWRCRYQHLVSYEDQRNETSNGERFMVDFETYQQLHSSSNTFKLSYPRIKDENFERMNPDIMASDKPPSAPDIYVFPNTIPGYNLRSKKWVDLNVDMIRDVTWNKKSFEHLVVDDETKELIQALVNHQLAAKNGTDIIDRKGNGLIILLHGGPGTAEIAEKPLFRVTCGDIGTKPEQVENYLDSVLHLGKIWDCIVLIDEAEVFLEQRSLDNLERNALVSVFLRVLEYYEGILILTSNRVGTFDEAFKSRILLSLHYENLTEGQRTKIWKNFLRRLRDMDEDGDKNDPSSSIFSATEPGPRKRKFQGDIIGIDFDDVDCYITELAKHELNGRQIRNVITTARQLAISRNQPMRFKHLEHVIKVSSKFDEYLKTVQEGYSDDQIARGEGFR
ncbi:AAA family ATPase [Annulohypoxylon nitens]|nr:AAA family ATPase [Annulohypoxylon nitens]